MLESLFNKVFEKTPTQAFTCEYRETVNTCFEEHVRTAGCFCPFLFCFQVIHFPYILFVFVIQLRSFIFTSVVMQHTIKRVVSIYDREPTSTL